MVMVKKAAVSPIIQSRARYIRDANPSYVTIEISENGLCQWEITGISTVKIVIKHAQI
jgi:hypothetical protein